MDKQLSLSFIRDELKEVKTHKREFLEKMDAIMPWKQLYELVKPCCSWWNASFANLCGVALTINKPKPGAVLL